MIIAFEISLPLKKKKPKTCLLVLICTPRVIIFKFRPYEIN